jgi:hypothetical protein
MYSSRWIENEVALQSPLKFLLVFHIHLQTLNFVSPHHPTPQERQPVVMSGPVDPRLSIIEAELRRLRRESTESTAQDGAGSQPAPRDRSDSIARPSIETDDETAGDGLGKKRRKFRVEKTARGRDTPAKITKGRNSSNNVGTVE